jgi:hypothetical protein
MNKSQLGLVGVTIVSTAILILAINFFIYPIDHDSTLAPDAEWSWNETDEEIILTHHGGDSLDSSSIYIAVSKEGQPQVDETIPDLTNGSDNRINRAFPDDPITSGDSVALDKSKIHEGKISLRWVGNDGDRIAILA